MKMYSPEDMDGADGLCCRQSRLRGLVGGLVVCAGLVGFVVVLQQRGAPRLAWGGCAVVVAWLVAWILADSVAKLGPGNWLMQLRPDGIWINLRSHQNRHLPGGATVVHLSYAEVASARRHVETWTTPSEPSSDAATRWKRESLELSLRSGEAGKLAGALAEERDRRATVRGTHQAVIVPAEGVVRIGWRGPGDDVAPPLGRVLDELGRYVEVAEPTRVDRGDWKQLGEAELDDLVAQLARSGDALEAARLLARRRGCSATEAHRLVEEKAGGI